MKRSCRQFCSSNAFYFIYLFNGNAKIVLYHQAHQSIPINQHNVGTMEVFRILFCAITIIQKINRYLPLPSPVTGSISPKAFIFFSNSVAGRSVMDKSVTISLRLKICPRPKARYTALIFLSVLGVTGNVFSLSLRLFCP